MAVADVNAAALGELSADLDDVIPLEIDVSDVASVEAGLADVIARSGRIDVVVNNAGILRGHMRTRSLVGSYIDRNEPRAAIRSPATTISKSPSRTRSPVTPSACST